jgi:hypothetical protein
LKTSSKEYNSWYRIFLYFVSFMLFTKYKAEIITPVVKSFISGFGGLGVSVLASDTQVRGFKPGRTRRIFKGGKILSTPSFGREVKPWGHLVAKVGTSKAGGTISQQAAVHPWLAADAHGNKQTIKILYKFT